MLTENLESELKGVVSVKDKMDIWHWEWIKEWIISDYQSSFYW